MGIVRSATPDDTVAIYSLLHGVNYQNLPSYSLAKPILERSPSLVIKQEDTVLLWAHFFGESEVKLDLAVHPLWQKKIITKSVCKDVLAYAFNLKQSDSVSVEAFSVGWIKCLLRFGFSLTQDGDERDGWVKLRLTREQFERKFRMRG